MQCVNHSLVLSRTNRRSGINRVCHLSQANESVSFFYLLPPFTPIPNFKPESLLSSSLSFLSPLFSFVTKWDVGGEEDIPLDDLDESPAGPALELHHHHHHHQHGAGHGQGGGHRRSSCIP